MCWVYKTVGSAIYMRKATTGAAWSWRSSEGLLRCSVPEGHKHPPAPSPKSRPESLALWQLPLLGHRPSALTTPGAVPGIYPPPTLSSPFSIPPPPPIYPPSHTCKASSKVWNTNITRKFCHQLLHKLISALIKKKKKEKRKNTRGKRHSVTNAENVLPTNDPSALGIPISPPRQSPSDGRGEKSAL